MKTTIGYCDHYVSKDITTVKDFVEDIDPTLVNSDMTREDIVELLKYSMGVEYLYEADRKMEVDYFTDLLNKYFTLPENSPEDIDLIIYSRGNSVSIGDPWDYTDGECINVPYFIQDKFAIKNAQVFNLEQECSGTLAAINIADAFITSGKMKKVLVLSANFFENPLKRLMGGMILVSDGVGIMEIVKRDKGLTVLDFISRTNGKYSKVVELSKPENFGQVVETGVNMIKTLLNNNGLSMDQISLIITQNISKNSWNYYCQMLECSKDIVFLENFSDGGHMGDVDIIRNLNTIIDKDRLQPGEYAVIYGLGTGTTWSAALIKAEE